ncbi:MAG TPA: glycerophosphodiester phosphodiesterase family protein [Puia sp.]|uniref:glycerophosphodiester phosphodiesterase n=1 Tax=Puia sp. TaxID=2045100 RepID=UPI002BCAB269|nr:glycerophosphodiester phosphodiesterase family protein [Puia sp.]HVU94199.1 glycerophosphodiester phosphodiesterase family protein [Puia sp.]
MKRKLILFLSLALITASSTRAQGPAYHLIAHRGGIVDRQYDEYDPRGIQAAIHRGYWMLEVDIHMSKDSVLVMSHDDSLDRVFGCPKRVGDMDYADISKLVSPRGHYHVLTFDELCRICSGKVRLMIDIKGDRDHLPPVFFRKMKEIMEKYNLLSTAWWINEVSRNYFMGKGKFEFRMTELEGMKRRLAAGEPIADNYFLFDAGNRLTSSAVKWCQLHGVTVVPTVNKDHYNGLEDHFAGAKRDIEFLKACGVTEFQIDSWYDTAFKPASQKPISK